jgi:hypothetical protein
MRTTIHYDVISCLAPIQCNGGPVHVVPVFPASTNFSFKFYPVGAQLYDSSLHISPVPNLFLHPYHLFYYQFFKMKAAKN